MDFQKGGIVVKRRDFIETILDSYGARTTQLETLWRMYRRDEAMQKEIAKMLNEIGEKVWKICQGNKCKLNRDRNE